MYTKSGTILLLSVWSVLLIAPRRPAFAYAEYPVRIVPGTENCSVSAFDSVPDMIPATEYDVLFAPDTEPDADLLRIAKGSYEDYIRYRSTVEEELKERMRSLNDALQTKVEKLGALLSEGSDFHVVLPGETLQDIGELSADEAAVLLDEQNDPASAMYGHEIELAQLTASNWSHMLAVYVSTHANADVKQPLDLINLKKISYNSVDHVFWDMQDITYYQDASGAVWIKVRGRDYEEMMARYHMNAARQGMLYELMQPEFQGVFAAITGDKAFVELDSNAQNELRSSLPEGLSVDRKNVVTAALSLLGRIHYFWGGKYPMIGWNNEWGLPRTVMSKSSVTYGTVRPYGLDCSGFVTWAFINAVGDSSVAEAIGNGTSNQWTKSSPIDWADAQPGDLAFYYPPGGNRINHIGIVIACEDSGAYRVVHCSSSHNGVVITSTEESAFRYIRRPYLYND